MKKALKWGAIICVGFIVVVIAALLIIPMFVDVQKYKPELEKWMSETTGRSFSVGDDLDLSLFPWAGVSFSEDVSIASSGLTDGGGESGEVSVGSGDVASDCLSFSAPFSVPISSGTPSSSPHADTDICMMHIKTAIREIINAPLLQICNLYL